MRFWFFVCSGPLPPKRVLSGPADRIIFISNLRGHELIATFWTQIWRNTDLICSDETVTLEGRTVSRHNGHFDRYPPWIRAALVVGSAIRVDLRQVSLALESWMRSLRESSPPASHQVVVDREATDQSRPRSDSVSTSSIAAWSCAASTLSCAATLCSPPSAKAPDDPPHSSPPAPPDKALLREKTVVHPGVWVEPEAVCDPSRPCSLPFSGYETGSGSARRTRGAQRGCLPWRLPRSWPWWKRRKADGEEWVSELKVHIQQSRIDSQTQ